jgi:hypothetical protein
MVDAIITFRIYKRKEEDVSVSVEMEKLEYNRVTGNKVYTSSVPYTAALMMGQMFLYLFGAEGVMVDKYRGLRIKKVEVGAMEIVGGGWKKRRVGGCGGDGAAVKDEPGVAIKQGEPGAAIKQEPGVEIKQEAGAAIKAEPGVEIKQEPGVAIKQEPGVEIKREADAVLHGDQVTWREGEARAAGAVAVKQEEGAGAAGAAGAAVAVKEEVEAAEAAFKAEVHEALKAFEADEEMAKIVKGKMSGWLSANAGDDKLNAEVLERNFAKQQDVLRESVEKTVLGIYRFHMQCWTDFDKTQA